LKLKSRKEAELAGKTGKKLRKTEEEGEEIT